MPKNPVTRYVCEQFGRQLTAELSTFHIILNICYHNNKIEEMVFF